MTYILNALLHYADVAHRRGYITAEEYKAILTIVITKYSNHIN